jgi:hypothetical protein
MNQHCRTKTKQSLHMLSYIRTYQANLPAPKNWYNPASRFRNYKQTYHASTVVHTTLLLDSETTSKPDGNSEHTLADSNKDTILGEILWQHADIPEFQRGEPTNKLLTLFSTWPPSLIYHTIHHLNNTSYFFIIPYETTFHPKKNATLTPEKSNSFRFDQIYIKKY